MSTSQRPPSRKQSWRPQETLDDRRRVRRMKRIGITLFGLGLLGLLVLLLVMPFLYPRIHVVSLPVVEYGVMEAPPIAYLAEDALALEPISEVVTIPDGKSIPRALPNLQTSASINSLAGQLQGLTQGGWASETVIFIVSAHGVSDAGVPYILCSDYDPAQKDTGRYEFEKLLAQVKSCRADMKLLILDTGRIQRDPRLGMMLNEFPRLAREVIREIDDPSLWVFISNAELERSHVSHVWRQSVFGHYIAEGLKGVADVNQDQEVNLDELGKFVAFNVREHVQTETKGNETQTPQLLWGGGEPNGGDRTQAVLPVSAKALAADKESAIEESKKGIEAPAKETQKAASRGLPFARGGLAMMQAEPAPGTKGKEPADAKAKKTDEPKQTDSGKKTEDKSKESKEKSDKAKTETKKAEPKAEPKPAKKKSKEPPLTGIKRLRKLLEDSWEIRDTLQDRAAHSNSPVDYAPHLWREFEMRLLGYEWLAFSGKSLGSRRTEDVGDALETSLLRLQELAYDRRMTGSPDPASIGERLYRARPLPVGDVDRPRSLAMVNQFAWPTAAAYPRQLRKLASELDAFLADSLASGAPEGFAEWVTSASAEHSDVVELRLAGQLMQTGGGLRWTNIRQALVTARTAEQIAARVQSFRFANDPAELIPELLRARLMQADELRVRANRLLLQGATSDQASARSLLQEAQKTYDRVGAELRVFEQAVALRNDLIHRLPYYVRWHCAAGLKAQFRAAASAPSAADITRLINGLRDLIQLQKSSRPVTSSEIEPVLAGLEQTRYAIEQGLMKAGVDDLEANPYLEGNLWKIGILLSTPLPDADTRQRLLAALRSKPPEGYELAPRTDMLSLPTVVTKSQDWEQVFAQARLESQVVELAEMVGQRGVAADALENSFGKLTEAHEYYLNHQDDEQSESKLYQAYRDFGGAIKHYYRGLPAAVAATEGDLVAISKSAMDQRGKRLQLMSSVDQRLRFVDARDTQVIEKHLPADVETLRAMEWQRQARLHALLLWHEDRFYKETAGATEEDLLYLNASARAYRSEADTLLPTPDDGRGPTFHVTFEGESSIKLTPEGNFQELKLSVRSKGAPQAEAKVYLQYDAELLEVRTGSGRRYYHEHRLAGDNDPSLVLREGRSESLELELRSRKRVELTTELVVKVRAEGVQYIHKLEIELPPPPAVDLVVRGISGSYGKQQDSALLRPFPNQPTTYRLDLVNGTKQAKVVQVQIFAPASDQTPFDSDGHLLPNLRELPKLLAAVGEMTLPPDGKPVPMAFPAPPPPEEGKDAPKKKEAPPPDGPDLRPAINFGLLAVVTDTKTGEKSVLPIRFAPQRPRRYIQPTVNYRFEQGEIEVIVKARDPDWLPPDGSKVEWVLGDDIPKTVSARLSDTITRENQSTRLYVKIGPQEQAVKTVQLRIDGFPRAFTYRVPIDEERLKIEPEEDLRQIEIYSPEEKTAYYPMPKIPVEFRVDAPIDAFVPDADGKLKDVLEIGLDSNNDRFLTGEKVLSFYSDRQAEVVFDSVSAGGFIKVEAKVSDFKVELDSDGLVNVQVGILARLVLGQGAVQSETWSNGGRPRNILLDAGRPEIADIEFPTKVLKGQPIPLKIKATDDRAGVDKVEALVDVDRIGNFGKLKPLPARQDPEDKFGYWMVELPTDELGEGRYQFLVRPTDKVGNVGKFAKRFVEIVVPAGKKPNLNVGNGNNIVEGVVLFGQDPVAGATVKLFGSKFPAQKTKDDGKFKFTDVVPGKYEIHVVATVKNKFRTPKVPITVQPSPKPGINIPIDLAAP